MLTRIEAVNLEALALFMFEEVDCSPEYEDDEFAVTFQGTRLYVERYVSHFRIEVGHPDGVVELPCH